MADQCLGVFDVCQRVAVRHDNVGAIMQRLRGIGDHDVPRAADIRVIQRLQQSDIGAWGQRTSGKALRDHDHTDPILAAQIDRAGHMRRRRTDVLIAIEVGDWLAWLADRRLALAHQFAAHLVERAEPFLGRGVGINQPGQRSSLQPLYERADARCNDGQASVDRGGQSVAIGLGPLGGEPRDVRLRLGQQRGQFRFLVLTGAVNAVRKPAGQSFLDIADKVKRQRVPIRCRSNVHHADRTFLIGQHADKRHAQCTALGEHGRRQFPWCSSHRLVWCDDQCLDRTRNGPGVCGCPRWDISPVPPR